MWLRQCLPTPHLETEFPHAMFRTQTLSLGARRYGMCAMMAGVFYPPVAKPG